MIVKWKIALQPHNCNWNSVVCNNYYDTWIANNEYCKQAFSCDSRILVANLAFACNCRELVAIMWKPGLGVALPSPHYSIEDNGSDALFGMACSFTCGSWLYFC